MDARTCGVRRLITLIEGLPWGSMSHGFDAPWSVTEELLASQLEHQIRVYGDKATRKKPGQLIPRPRQVDAPPKPTVRQRALEWKRMLGG